MTRNFSEQGKTGTPPPTYSEKEERRIAPQAEKTYWRKKAKIEDPRRPTELETKNLKQEDNTRLYAQRRSSIWLPTKEGTLIDSVWRMDQNRIKKTRLTKKKEGGHRLEMAAKGVGGHMNRKQ